MNRAMREALRRQAECRQAWNALDENADDAAVTEARNALEAADQAVLEALDALDHDDGAPAELRDRISLARYMDAVVHEREADGAEAELRAELRLADNAIPLEALLPTAEERADAISPQDSGGDPLAFDTVYTTTGPMLTRLFTATDAAFLGVAMPTVPPGERVYPVMTDGTTAAMQARGDKPDAGAAKFSVVNATPHRLTGRYVFDLEGVATLGGLLESTLRSDLRTEMGYQLDRQILLGDGSGPNVEGLLKALAGQAPPGTTFPTSGGAAAADVSAVLTWALAKQMVTGSLDGRTRRTERDLRFLFGGDTYDLGRTLYRSANAESLDAYDEIMRLGARSRRSFQIPASAVLPAGTGKANNTIGTKKVQSALVNAEPGAAVAPIWQGITLIRDPYTNAGEGQIMLTAHMLYDFVLRRQDGWLHYWIRTEA